MYVKLIPENLNPNHYPHTPQALIIVKWPPHTISAVVEPFRIAESYS